ncbi:RsmB/NOP family class I SAM-dependent RNA methyltransferase [Gulosibacter molinativorax]|uniref:Methyltransferase n=1 Tax=Gulosibacter molinativorax TaxID=256821 RepID=A0ABT7C787_9MICO|nr:transcription antitermination factor NusB [Gulosibacter molinativorax]MDJ1371076.1 methyltransferase [Gulosibacter molinativorax]QUY61436.1 Ribosomal RNA small subunit methyltransferase B [Gulosibacter molinativorax]
MSEQRDGVNRTHGGRGKRSGGQRRQARPTKPGARDVALDVLLAVAEDDAYSNLLLPHRIREARLSHEDAGLATELTYGTLRRSGYYDAIIEMVAKRPIDEVDTLARAALQLGAHQLLATRVATHAAVNETVSAVRRRAGQGPSGFVNANLRRISEADAQTWHERVADSANDELERLALVESHPLWIVRALREALALEHREAELEETLRANNESPHVQLAALPELAEREAVIAAHPELLEPEPASPVAMRLSGGDPSDLEEVRSGRVRVQDAGSQLVALALSRVEPLRAGERILDLCAGPGGKSALLAAEVLAAGAKFQANEVVPARADLVRKALRAVADGDALSVTELDGREYANQPDAYDRILVDAPCTGLGALRRRPEARWRKQLSDVADLSALQEELLDAAVTAVKPGGIVAYVTCSPHPAETVGIVRRAARAGGLDVLDATAIYRDLAPDLDITGISVGDGNAVQLWPHRHGTDAMFLTLLRKTD